MQERSGFEEDELSPDAAGLAGDTQQLVNVADVASESVGELVVEGNAFEANLIQGGGRRTGP